VSFGRLRFTRASRRSPWTALYERPTSGSELGFAPVREVLEGARHVEGSIRREDLPAYEPTIVVKLLDCISSDMPPPLSTTEILMALGSAELPAPMPEHVQDAPFLMLGGGLIHPLVSFALATHFLPNFKTSGDDSIPRYVVMHDTPGEGDKLRRFEQKHMSWSPNPFNLQRVTCDIPDFLKQLIQAIAAGPNPVGGAT
jgi:hypothetical protein